MVHGSREAPCAASRVGGDSHQEGGVGWMVPGSRGAPCAAARVGGDSHQEGGVGWVVHGSREVPCAASRVRGDSHQEGGAGWVVHGSREVPCAEARVGGDCDGGWSCLCSLPHCFGDSLGDQGSPRLSLGCRLAANHSRPSGDSTTFGKILPGIPRGCDSLQKWGKILN